MDVPGLALKHILESDSRFSHLEFHHKFFVDNELACLRLAGVTWPGRQLLNHVAKWKKCSKVHLFWFSPCCFDISSNGKGRGKDGKSLKLMKYAANYITRKCPKVVCVEQVPTMLSKKHKPIWDRLVKTLQKRGYVVHYKIISSSTHSPQNRRRLFLVALLDLAHEFQWPTLLLVKLNFFKKVLDPFDEATDQPGRMPPKDKLKLGRLSTKDKLKPKAVGKPRTMAAAPAMKKAKRKPVKDRERKLVKRAIVKLKAKKESVKKAIIDVGCTLKYATYQRWRFPCLTTTRCKVFKYWILCRGRYVRLSEIFRGFRMNDNIEDHGSVDVSEHQMGGMLGNAIVFPTARAVLVAALLAADFT